MLNEEQKLRALDADGGDELGFAVSINGDTSIVGAHFDDEGGAAAGAAYVFELDESTGEWSQAKKLLADDVQPHDQLGFAVTLAGNIAVVGAPIHNVGGVNAAGAVYVFERDEGGSGNWGQVIRLVAEDPSDNDQFGWSVSIDDAFLLVGTHFEDAAYIFQRDAGGANNWGQIKRLTPSTGLIEGFGQSVSLHGVLALIGANTADEQAGAAYVFARDQGGPDSWGEVARLTASDAEPGDRFGVAVSLHGPSAAVGAWIDDACGVARCGSAYIFEEDHGGPGAWGEIQKLVPDDGEDNDSFGAALAVFLDRLVVGAPGVVEACPPPQLLCGSGALYLFAVSGGSWQQLQKVTASDSGSSVDLALGLAVAMRSPHAVAGAPGDDESCPGDPACDSGAAYLFRVEGPIFSDGFEGGDTSAWSQTVP